MSEINSKEELIEAVQNLQENAVTDTEDFLTEDDLPDDPEQEIPENVVTRQELEHYVTEDCEEDWCNTIRDGLGVGGDEEETDEEKAEGESEEDEETAEESEGESEESEEDEDENDHWADW